MKKILVVDDEPYVTDIVKRKLEAQNYEVVVAQDGEEALNMAKAEKPHLIVLDIMMPVINGLEVCSRLKHDPKLSDIPVLMLTGRMKYSDKRMAEQCGADAYIPKPCSSVMLMDQIKKYTLE